MFAWPSHKHKVVFMWRSRDAYVEKGVFVLNVYKGVFVCRCGVNSRKAQSASEQQRPDRAGWERTPQAGRQKASPQGGCTPHAEVGRHPAANEAMSGMQCNDPNPSMTAMSPQWRTPSSKSIYRGTSLMLILWDVWMQLLNFWQNTDTDSYPM